MTHGGTRVVRGEVTLVLGEVTLAHNHLFSRMFLFCINNVYTVGRFRSTVSVVDGGHRQTVKANDTY